MIVGLFFFAWGIYSGFLFIRLKTQTLPAHLKEILVNSEMKAGWYILLHYVVLSALCEKYFIWTLTFVLNIIRQTVPHRKWILSL